MKEGCCCCCGEKVKKVASKAKPALKAKAKPAAKKKAVKKK